MYRNPDPRNQALFTGNHWATTIQAKTALWPYHLGWFCRSDGAVAPALGGIKRLLRQLPRKPPAVHVCCHEQSCSRVGTHVVRATGKLFFFFIWGEMKWEDWSVTTEWPCSQSLREHANGDMLTNTRFSGQFFWPSRWYSHDILSLSIQNYFDAWVGLDSSGSQYLWPSQWDSHALCGGRGFCGMLQVVGGGGSRFGTNGALECWLEISPLEERYEGRALKRLRLKVQVNYR